MPNETPPVDAMQGTLIAEGFVKPEWIDVNDHMNVAWYVLAFDLGVDSLWQQFGITSNYIESTRGSTFAVDCHISYRQELIEGDPYIVTCQVLAYDEKRIHHFQRLYHAEQRYLSATAEWMSLHVNLDSRRVTPWPEAIRERIGEFSNAQATSTAPAGTCRQLRLKNPSFNVYTAID